MNPGSRFTGENALLAKNEGQHWHEEGSLCSLGIADAQADPAGERGEGQTERDDRHDDAARLHEALVESEPDRERDEDEEHGLEWRRQGTPQASRA
jgi:hypothetical protein